MALVSKGFRLTKRLDHFDKHRLEHAWADQFEYEERADSFLTAPASPAVLECRRRNGDLVRFDPASCEFGILAADGYIVTYYYRRRNGFAYFRAECTK